MPASSSQSVFVSYAREDTVPAQLIAEALRGHGIEVWFDQNELRGADAWDAKIKRQIRECSLFLPIISRRTHARNEGYFRLEWKLAAERTFLMREGVPFIMPVVIDDAVEDHAMVPEAFMRVQWTRLAGAQPTPEFCRQVQRLLEILRTPGACRETPPRPESPSAPRVRAAGAPWRRVLLGAAVLALVAAGWVALRKDSAVAPPLAPVAKSAADRHRIAVLPLMNYSTDGKDEYFADGMTEEIISTLSKIKGLAVIAHTSVMRYKTVAATVAQVGRELMVGAVIEGSVRKEGNDLRITVQLIDAVTEAQLWSTTYNRLFKDVFAVQTDVAEGVAEALKVQLLGGEKERLGKAPTASLEAYQLYQSGRFWWSKRTKVGFENAVLSFNQALVQDPDYAAAHAALAACYVIGTEFAGISNREALAKATTEATKALELDPNLAEPHAVLGIVNESRFDWAEADKEFRRATELNPSYATAHHWFSRTLRFRGQLDEAMSEIRLAEELDPRSLIIKVNIVECYFWKGQEDLAIQFAQDVLKIDPDFAALHNTLGGVYLKKRSYAEATAEFRKAQALITNGVFAAGNLGHSLARSGHEAEARDILRSLEDRQKRGMNVEADIAFVHLGLGEIDQALAALARAFAAGEIMTGLLDPNWQEVWPDPRAQVLLHKMGIERPGR